MTLRKTLIALAVTTPLLYGCGGGGGGSSSTTTLTGTFLDAAVAGLDYTTSSGLSGTTDALGRFQYAPGDTVTFTIGKLRLGAAQPAADGLVTPQHLVEHELGSADQTTKEAKLALTLRFLQSLDADDDPTNGITIPAEVKTDLADEPTEIHLLSSDETTLLSTLPTTVKQHIDEDGDGHLDRSETEARDHFDKSRQDWEHGIKPEHTDMGGAGGGANIGYLKNNHASYYQAGSSTSPVPTKDAGTRTISWQIEASTAEQAQVLADHIRFMDDKLDADQNPRAFDKLFLLEAYMKYNNRYDTTVTHTAGSTQVQVVKQAQDDCAYAVIAAHADAVSGDFFAQGVIDKDYSAVAETILAGVCAAERSTLDAYIATRQRVRDGDTGFGRGHGTDHR